MWAVHLFFGLRSDFRPCAKSTACRLLRGMKIPIAAVERRLEELFGGVCLNGLPSLPEKYACTRHFSGR
jgi:hypothetical protein